MKALRLCPRLPEGPQSLCLIDLAPSRRADFRAALTGCQHEPERPAKGPHLAACSPKRANLPVRQNALSLAILLCRGSLDRGGRRIINQLVLERPCEELFEVGENAIGCDR